MKEASSLNIPAKPWTGKAAPKRVLVIRLQAMGDMMITLPYVQALRKMLPAATKLDLLTRKEVDPVPRNIYLFDNIYSIGGGRNYKKILPSALLLLPRLLLRRYDMIIDLQNTFISRMVWKLARPGAWSLFDKYSPVAAGERTRLTIEAVGLGPIRMDTHFRLKDDNRGRAILKSRGWNGSDQLVVLNPAGFVATRNWDMPNYVRFARMWLEQFPNTQFLVLGTSAIAAKAAFLEEVLGDRLINLVDQTSPVDAFAILQLASFVLSEDSGLMHMAWVSGVPTMVLFGSTKSYWSRPLGTHTFFLDSSDLPCGNCMESVCRMGDMRCLTRYTPGLVFQHAMSLLRRNKNNQPVVN